MKYKKKKARNKMEQPKNGETAVYDKTGVKPDRDVTLLADNNEILMLSEAEDNQLREALNYLNSD